VHPIVEYNSIIWSPSTARDIDAVESVGFVYSTVFLTVFDDWYTVGTVLVDM